MWLHIQSGNGHSLHRFSESSHDLSASLLGIHFYRSEGALLRNQNKFQWLAGAKQFCWDWSSTSSSFNHYRTDTASVSKWHTVISFWLSLPRTARTEFITFWLFANEFPNSLLSCAKTNGSHLPSLTILSLFGCMQKQIVQFGWNMPF